MARGHLRHFQKDSAGNAVQNAAVTVKDLAGSNLTLYADASSGTTVANPIATTSAGLAECWIAAPQSVGLTITDNGGTATAGGQTLNPFSHALTVEVLPTPEDTYYVRVSEPAPTIHISPTGDDTFDGRWDRPMLTIQTALDSFASGVGGEVVLHGSRSGLTTYGISAPLFVSLGQGLSADGRRQVKVQQNTSGVPIIMAKGAQCHSVHLRNLQLAYGASQSNPLARGIYFPYLAAAAGTGYITAASTTLTASTGTFTAGMVGNRITVAGAGAGGGTLETIVTVFTSSSVVTLANAAVTTVSSGSPGAWNAGGDTGPYYWWDVQGVTISNAYDSIGQDPSAVVFSNTLGTEAPIVASDSYRSALRLDGGGSPGNVFGMFYVTNAI